MRAYYDFHIHSALSPCADEDMTPNNIVNMARLKGLSMIAVTDHNSCGNLRAVMQVAANDPLVLPGIEIETAEEVHILGYFPSLEQAEAMEKVVKEHLPFIPNRPEIFGRQLYMDADDTVTGEEEGLLVTATTLGVADVFSMVQDLGGVAVPAHIDRSSYSILSNLGFLPPELAIRTVEITAKNRARLEEQYKNLTILTSSDAHYLGDIAEMERYMDISTKTIPEILEKLTNKNA